MLLVPAASRNTKVWAYDGTVPGTALRFKQGERLHVLFNNRLPDASTVHWHGMRLPNAMDGVPGMTQPLAPFLPLVAEGAKAAIDALRNE